MLKKSEQLEVGFVLFLMAIFGVFLAAGLDYPPETRRLPLLISALTIVLLGIQLFSLLAKARRSQASPAGEAVPVDWRKSLLCFGVLGIALAVAFLFGIIVSSVTIVFGCGLVFGARNRVKLSLISLATGLVVYVVFVRVFNVVLYRGILF